MKNLKVKSILLGFTAFFATVLFISSCEQESVINTHDMAFDKAEQNAQNPYEFEGLVPLENNSALIREKREGSTYFKLNEKAMKNVMDRQPEYMNFRIQVASKVINLELEKWNIFTDDVDIEEEDGIFYHGISKDEPNSIVAVSFFEDDLSVMIMRSEEKTSFVAKEDGLMVYYGATEGAFLNPSHLSCTHMDSESSEVDEALFSSDLQIPEVENIIENRSACPSVRVRYTLDYSFREYFGFTRAAPNFVNARFNEAKAMYAAQVNVPILQARKRYFRAWQRVLGSTRNAMYDDFKAKHHDESSNSWDINAVVVVINNGASSGGLATHGTGCPDEDDDYSGVYPPICHKGAAPGTVNDGCMPIHLIGIHTGTGSNASAWNTYVFPHELGHNFGIPDSNNGDIMDDGNSNSNNTQFYSDTATEMYNNWVDCYCN